MDHSLESSDSERIGLKGQVMSSERAELGGYTVILKRTIDSEDLVTVTDSEVLCRLVIRWGR